MKFAKTLSLLTLVTGFASGTTVVERDLPTIQNVLSTVNTQLQSFADAVNAYNGGDYSSLTQASNQVLDTVKQGTATVAGTSPLTETEALGVASSVGGLTTAVQNTVNNLISKKDLLVAAGAGAQVSQSLSDQKAAAQALSDAITSKIPPSLQSLASQFTGQVSATLQQGIDAFAGTGGGAAPGGSGGSAPGSSAPSGTAPTSAAGASSPAGTSSGVVPVPSVSSPSQASVPATAPAVPTHASGSVIGLTSAPGRAPTGSSTLVPFTGDAAKFGSFGGSTLVLLSVVVGIFA